MAKNDQLKTASVLSFNRHLDASDGRMFAVNWVEIAQGTGNTPILIQAKSVRVRFRIALKIAKKLMKQQLMQQ